MGKRKGKKEKKYYKVYYNINTMDDKKHIHTHSIATQKREERKKHANQVFLQGTQLLNI